MQTVYIWTVVFVIHQAFSQSSTDLDRLTGGENIAIGKVTRQSSSYVEDHFTFSSNLSVDGNEDGDFSHNSCSSTSLNGPRPAWWSVDFGEQRIVKKIIIFNREGYTNRLIGARVLGFMKDGKELEIDSSANYNQDKIIIDVTINELLHNVTIVLGNDSEQNIINICEVEIYADLNVARRKPANQTLTWSTFGAELAVDGQQSGNFDKDKSCTASQRQNQIEASWSVNLEEEYFISFIKIFNRDNVNSNYGQRLGNFTVTAYTRDNTPKKLYQDASGNPGTVIQLPLYNIPTPMRSIKISVPLSQAILTLCEVEVYKAIECQIYHLVNGRVSIAMNGDNEQNYTYRASLRLDCLTGFQFSPNLVSTTATCQMNGTWTEHRTCQDINECELDGNSCNNHGVCKNSAGSFTCQCYTGYTGPICETDIDECKAEGPSPCNSHGECIDAVANIACQCHAGYTGRRCETDIDECRAEGPSPCNNHGECVDGVANFTCQCHAGYTGRKCEIVIQCSGPFILPNNSMHLYEEGIEGNLTYNSTISIICQEGYKLSGTDLIRCNEFGVWDGLFGTCHVIDCGWPEDVPHDVPLLVMSGIAGGFSYNATACIQSNEHVKTFGDIYESLRCSSDGYWRRSLRKCFDTTKKEPYMDDDGKKVILPVAVLVPICLILIATNIVTLLKLRRYACYRGPPSFSEQMQSGMTIADQFGSSQNEITGRQQIRLIYTNGDIELQRRKSGSEETHSQGTGPYDELQKEHIENSEYDELKFKRDLTSNKGTMYENTEEFAHI